MKVFQASMWLKIVSNRSVHSKMGAVWMQLLQICYDSQIELMPRLGERHSPTTTFVLKSGNLIFNTSLWENSKLKYLSSYLVGFILFWHLTLKEQISKFKLSPLKVHLRWQRFQHCRQWYSSASNCSSTQIGFFCSGATQTCVAFIVN